MGKIKLWDWLEPLWEIFTFSTLHDNSGVNISYKDLTFNKEIYWCKNLRELEVILWFDLDDIYNIKTAHEDAMKKK